MTDDQGPATPPQDSLSSSAEGSQKGLGRKLVMVGVLAALVLAGLVLYGDVEALARDLGACEWEWFGAAVGLASFNYALRFFRWQYYLRILGCPVPTVDSALIFLSGFAMSVTPGKVGEVFKSALLLESYGYPVQRTAPIVVAERVTDLMALVMITALGALSFDGGITVTVLGASVVAAGVFVCMYRPLGNLLLNVSRRLPVVNRFTDRLAEAYESLRSLTRPVPLLLSTLVSFVAWVAEVGSLFCVLISLNTTLDWESTFFAYGAPTIMGALAMLPGGLGVTEAGMTGLLEALSDGSIDASTATAATLLTRLSTLWWAVLVGVIALFAYRFRRRRRNAA